MIETFLTISTLVFIVVLIFNALGSVGQRLTSSPKPDIPEDNDALCLQYDYRINFHGSDNEIIKSGKDDDLYFAEIRNKKMYEWKRIEHVRLSTLVDRINAAFLEWKTMADRAGYI